MRLYASSPPQRGVPPELDALNGVVESVHRHCGEQLPFVRLGIVGVLFVQMNRPQVNRRQSARQAAAVSPWRSTRAAGRRTTPIAPFANPARQCPRPYLRRRRDDLPNSFQDVDGEMMAAHTHAQTIAGTADGIQCGVTQSRVPSRRD